MPGLSNRVLQYAGSHVEVKVLAVLAVCGNWGSPVSTLWSQDARRGLASAWNGEAAAVRLADQHTKPTPTRRDRTTEAMIHSKQNSLSYLCARTGRAPRAGRADAALNEMDMASSDLDMRKPEAFSIKRLQLVAMDSGFLVYVVPSCAVHAGFHSHAIFTTDEKSRRIAVVVMRILRFTADPVCA